MKPTRWLVTVRFSEGRTQDFSCMARNAYAAEWLHRRLHPDHQIIAVRPSRS